MGWVQFYRKEHPKEQREDQNHFDWLCENIDPFHLSPYFSYSQTGDCHQRTVHPSCCQLLEWHKVYFCVSTFFSCIPECWLGYLSKQRIIDARNRARDEMDRCSRIANQNDSGLLFVPWDALSCKTAPIPFSLSIHLCDMLFPPNLYMYSIYSTLYFPHHWFPYSLFTTLFITL